ncbi:MAG: M48 family metallopeptidase [Gammaproteobacteria bacterium]|nr:M48 family metallopeptidase [Gammaproteobacteria bacterium]
MEYSNPKIPEGINTSIEHPVREFLQLTSGVVGVVVIAVFILGVLADRLAHHIPFSAEQNINIPLDKHEVKGQAINRYLESLTHKIAQAADLPPDMKLKIHYVNSKTVNAFATLGGNLIMYRGLMEKMPSENALVMVLAHEIAHIKHRHPIRSVGRGMVIGLTLGLVSSSLGDSLTGNFVNKTGQVTALKFSRDHENEADATALQVLQKLYGHVQGAEAVFKALEAERKRHGKNEPGFEFLSTHPFTGKRLQRLEQAAQNTQNDAQPLTPLPKQYKYWLKAK